MPGRGLEADLRIGTAHVPLVALPLAAPGVGHEMLAADVEAGARASCAVVDERQTVAPGAILARQAEPSEAGDAVDLERVADGVAAAVVHTVVGDGRDQAVAGAVAACE